MIASSNLSPPTRTEPEYTMPPSEITPTSVVPPPMSTTIEPVASATGRSAPIAAAIGSSIRYTCERAGADRDLADRAPLDLGRAAGHADDDARRRREQRVSCTFLMNCLSICSVTVKSAITPSFIGRMAMMLPGVLPSICFASWPTAWMVFLPLGPAFLADRDDRRFIQHDAFAAHVDQRVRGAEVDREVVGEVAAQEIRTCRNRSPGSCLAGRGYTQCSYNTANLSACSKSEIT